MRGAGEILGNRQHGYIASVGFHLYTKLLSQAVRSHRQAAGLPARENSTILSEESFLPVNVELPLSTGIPVAYVADQDARLRLYRRLADIQTEDELEAISEEFTDRFGPLPEEVRNLKYQMLVKIKAERAGLTSIGVEADQIVLHYPPLPAGVTTRSLPDMGQLARAGKNAYWLPYASSLDSWQERLLQVLDELDKTPIFS
jgi:transcription-repair coupling factor (superfamily II helicase)